MATIINNAVVVFLLLVAFGTFAGNPACDAIAHTILAVAVYGVLEWIGFFPFVPGWLILAWSAAFGTRWYVETRQHRSAVLAGARPRPPVRTSGPDRRWSALLAGASAVVLMTVGAG